MTSGRALALGLAVAFGTASAAFAQGQNGGWYYNNPPPPDHDQYLEDNPAIGPYDNAGRRCSLRPRVYAYINECGELIPGIWDPIPGSG